MTTNDHNTIGPRVGAVHFGHPEFTWDIVSPGGTTVGAIEAEYGDDPAYAATRQSRYVVTGYKVWWFDCDDEPFFPVCDHGTARKAFAAAKAYAKATTKAVRQTA